MTWRRRWGLGNLQLGEPAESSSGGGSGVPAQSGSSVPDVPGAGLSGSAPPVPPGGWSCPCCGHSCSPVPPCSGGWPGSGLPPGSTVPPVPPAPWVPPCSLPFGSVGAGRALPPATAAGVEDGPRALPRPRSGPPSLAGRCTPIDVPAGPSVAGDGVASGPPARGETIDRSSPLGRTSSVRAARWRGGVAAGLTGAGTPGTGGEFAVVCWPASEPSVYCEPLPMISPHTSAAPGAVVVASGTPAGGGALSSPSVRSLVASVVAAASGTAGAGGDATSGDSSGAAAWPTTSPRGANGSDGPSSGAEDAPATGRVVTRSWSHAVDPGDPCRGASSGVPPAADGADARGLQVGRVWLRIGCEDHGDDHRGGDDDGRRRCRHRTARRACGTAPRPRQQAQCSGQACSQGAAGPSEQRFRGAVADPELVGDSLHVTARSRQLQGSGLSRGQICSSGGGPGRRGPLAHLFLDALLGLRDRGESPQPLPAPGFTGAVPIFVDAQPSGHRDQPRLKSLLVYLGMLGRTQHRLVHGVLAVLRAARKAARHAQ